MLSLSLQVVGDSMFGGEKRRVFPASNALDGSPNLPDDRVPLVRKVLPANWSRSRLLAGQLLSWKWWLARTAWISTCGRRQVITFGVTSTASAITMTMLHLCSAPCKALRFAPPALRAAFGP
jgi:hypothetical protein